MDLKDAEQAEKDDAVSIGSLKGKETRPLSKTEARSKLPDVVDNEEADLARLVMEVSPAVSAHSESPIRDELKESLRSENFFLNKMDHLNKSPKTGEHQKPDSNNIRIEIGGEKQANPDSH